MCLPQVSMEGSSVALQNISVLCAAGICFVAQVRCSETEVQEYMLGIGRLTIAGVLGMARSVESLKIFPWI